MSQTLKCPECEDGMKTTDSRAHTLGVQRRRRCIICGLTYTTLEVILPEGNSIEERFDSLTLKRHRQAVKKYIYRIRGELDMILNDETGDRG